MAWIAVDKDGEIWIYDEKPVRKDDTWAISYTLGSSIALRKGSIIKLMERELTWEDEPIEI